MEPNTAVKPQQESLFSKFFISKSQVNEGLRQTMHKSKQPGARNNTRGNKRFEF